MRVGNLHLSFVCLGGNQRGVGVRFQNTEVPELRETITGCMGPITFYVSEVFFFCFFLTIEHVFADCFHTTDFSWFTEISFSNAWTRCHILKNMDILPILNKSNFSPHEMYIHNLLFSQKTHPQNEIALNTARCHSFKVTDLKLYLTSTEKTEIGRSN